MFTTLFPLHVRLLTGLSRAALTGQPQGEGERAGSEVGREVKEIWEELRGGVGVDMIQYIASMQCILYKVGWAS